MDRIYWSTGQFVLGIFAGAMVVAVYAVAIQLSQIFMAFSTAITNVFLPKVTAMVAKGHSEKEISDLFIRTGRIQYLIMAFILTGFILFGKQFVILWAGSGYEEAYYIALLFFIPLTIPLIQNLGITILQARNQMKFRSSLYVVIAICSLGISIPLAKLYGGIGCAVGTASALVAGQIIAMNIYYYKRIHIDIPLFWKEILKMSIAPAVLGIIGCFLLQQVEMNTVILLVSYIIAFSIIYLIVIWKAGMNAYERELFAAPVLKLYHRMIK